MMEVEVGDHNVLLVKVENNKVYVSVQKRIQGQPKRIKWMGARDQAVLHTVMLLGGGMEVAAYMIDMASSITIIGSSELPYQKTLGPELGKVTMMMLEERGVRFYMNDAVAEVQGQNRRVKAVKLKSGITIEADLLIAGIGVNPNSEFLKGSPIRMDSKNYVIVDKYMRTNITDVYCAGDLTSFPLKMAKGQNVSIGHWQTAQAHGYGEGYTEMVLKGRFENMKFLALYLKDDEVVAAAGLNVEPAVSVVAERLAEGRVITKAEAESDDLSWLKLQPM
ncbi:hypothetical protein cypCar_00001949 [Cyprinus carpio]|nr:hypothetical protein cypCar_00001949 [Cyprinus carpio]